MISINLLPKNLRRVREPGYWRVLAVLFPLLVLGAAFVFQYLAYQTVTNLEQDKQTREDQLALLQPYLREQRDLLARQKQLNELISIARAVRQNQIVWTGEIAGLLETLPPRGTGSQPNIDFKSLNMTAVVPARSDPNKYEGKSVVAEMNVSGDVVNPETLAQFIRALEQSTNYGVAFQSASRQGDQNLYSYNLTVGALAEGQR